MTCPLFTELYLSYQPFRDFIDRHGGPAECVSAPSHTHHVWGGKTRINNKSNRLRVNFWTHDFLHQESRLGKVAAIWAVSKQDGFSWEDLNTAAGLNVKGWLETLGDDLPEPFNDYRQQLLGWNCEIL